MRRFRPALVSIVAASALLTPLTSAMADTTEDIQPLPPVRYVTGGSVSKGSTGGGEYKNEGSAGLSSCTTTASKLAEAKSEYEAAVKAHSEAKARQQQAKAKGDDDAADAAAEKASEFRRQANLSMLTWTNANSAHRDCLQAATNTTNVLTLIIGAFIVPLLIAGALATAVGAALPGLPALPPLPGLPR